MTDPERPHLGGNFDGGDLGTQYPADLWPWLLETFSPKTIADVGCGTGESLGWFVLKGLHGVGVDGLPWNVDRARERVSGVEILLHDFRDGPCSLPEVDLVWCADVAEHVEEEHVGGFLATLVQGRVLAMCQGTEANAEDGWHHVNNKPENYWVEKLADVGMVEDVELTKKSREVAGGRGWWGASGRIYRRDTATGSAR